MEDSYTAAHTQYRLGKEFRVGSDAVITQDISKNKSEKSVRTTSENIVSEFADHYHITRTYSPPAYLVN